MTSTMTTGILPLSERSGTLETYSVCNQNVMLRTAHSKTKYKTGGGGGGEGYGALFN